MKIIVTRAPRIGPDDDTTYVAFVDGKPETKGDDGRSCEEAVGILISEHPEMFPDIQVVRE